MTNLETEVAITLVANEGLSALLDNNGAARGLRHCLLISMRNNQIHGMEGLAAA